VNIEYLRDYCIAKPGATESFPFGEDTLVFKIGGKLFLLTGLQEANRFNAKCDPEEAVTLREQHPEVQPGYHMNKQHWNTVYMDGQLSDKQLCQMIDHSYQLVFNSLPKTLQAEIAADL